MIKRPLLVFALVFFSAVQINAQCTPQHVWGGPFRHAALDVFADQNNLWVATSYGVALYDITPTSGAAPRGITSIALPDTTIRVRSLNQNAWAASGDTIYALRHDAGRLSIIGSLDLNVTINDLIAVQPYLYAATSGGLAIIDVSIPSTPLLVNSLTVSKAPALSLARFENTIYVADGDSSVDMFTVQVPNFPQRLGDFTAFPQNSSVRVSGTNIYVSDGQQTQVFAAGSNPATKIGTTSSVGTSALFPLSSSIVYAAGRNRVLRVLDFSAPSQPVVLYENEIPTTRGTINRIEAITGTANRIFVAAGDAGLISYDVTSFKSPFPLRANLIGSVGSVVVLQDRIVVAPSSGGLRAYSVASNDALSPLGTWEAPKVWTLQDGSGSVVLASSGKTLTAFNVSTGTGTAQSTGNFADNIRSAVLIGNTVYAVLADGSVWRADASAATMTPARVDISTIAVNSIHRNGTAVATAEFTESGTTVVRYWSDGDVSKAPLTASVEGAATSGIALASGKIALSTFKGITIIATPSMQTTLIAGVPPGVATRMNADYIWHASGTSLLQYHIGDGAKVGEFRLSSISSLQRGDIGSTIFAATDAGVTSVRSNAAVALPVRDPIVPTSFFFRQLALAPGKVLLRDGPSVQVFFTRASGTLSPGPLVTIDSGTIDIAATEDRIHALTSRGKLIEYDYAGRELRSFSIDEGADATALALRMLRGALHIGVLRGCSVGACEYKTVVVQSTTLTQASTYGGAVIDVADGSGSTAYILVEGTPRELRRVDVSNPLVPVTAASRAAASFQAIAYSTGGFVMVATSAAPISLDPVTLQDKQGGGTPITETPRLSGVDGRVAASDECWAAAGYAAFPFIGKFGSSFIRPKTPATALRVAHRDGVWYFLTDFSLEVYSNKAPVKRDRSVRR